MVGITKRMCIGHQSPGCHCGDPVQARACPCGVCGRQNGTGTGFLGAFAKLRKATISFVISVCLSAWKNSAPIGRIFMKFDIGIFRIFVEKIQVLLTSDENNGYFTWRPVYIYDNSSLNST